jgi:hypothetical protein
MCADYDEIEIARWLLDRGMNVDEPAVVDAGASEVTQLSSPPWSPSQTSG